MGIPCILLIGFMIFMPQSQYWLKLRAESEQQTTSSKKRILNKLVDNKSSWINLLKPQNRGILITIIAVAILNQLTAINALLQYAPSILKSSGFVSDNSSMGASLILAVTNIIGTMIAIFFVDKIGRTFLLKVGTS